MGWNGRLPVFSPSTKYQFLQHWSRGWSIHNRLILSLSGNKIYCYVVNVIQRSLLSSFFLLASICCYINIPLIGVRGAETWKKFLCHFVFGVNLIWPRSQCYKRRMIAASVDISFDKLWADYREFICQIFARVGDIKGTFVRASSERICIRFNVVFTFWRVDMMILFANSWCSNIRFDVVKRNKI